MVRYKLELYLALERIVGVRPSKNMHSNTPFLIRGMLVAAECIRHCDIRLISVTGSWVRIRSRVARYFRLSRTPDWPNLGIFAETFLSRYTRWRLPVVCVIQGQ